MQFYRIRIYLPDIPCAVKDRLPLWLHLASLEILDLRQQSYRELPIDVMDRPGLHEPAEE